MRAQSPREPLMWARSNAKILFSINRTPDAMTKRARVYFLTGGLRHGVTGLLILLLPWLFSSAAFIPIFNLLGLQTWSWIMIVVGLFCVWSSVTRNGDLARFAIVCSAMITAVMAAGLWFGLSLIWWTWYLDVGHDVFWTVVWSRTEQLPPAVRLLSLVVPPSPVIAIWATAFVVKDFVMCAQPLRVPLEERVGDSSLMGV